MKQTPLSWLQPQTITTEAELRRGLHMVMLDGIYTQALVTLTGGAFLVAFALLLGASNLVIGLISAVSALTQTLQIPTIYVVEATRRRKALSVLTLSIGRIAWLAVALLPWIMPERTACPCFSPRCFGAQHGGWARVAVLDAGFHSPGHPGELHGSTHGARHTNRGRSEPCSRLRG